MRPDGPTATDRRSSRIVTLSFLCHCGVGVGPTKVLTENFHSRSLSSIHILYNQALVGGLSASPAPATQIDNLQLTGGSMKNGLQQTGDATCSRSSVRCACSSVVGNQQPHLFCQHLSDALESAACFCYTSTLPWYRYTVHLDMSIDNAQPSHESDCDMDITAVTPHINQITDLPTVQYTT